MVRRVRTPHEAVAAWNEAHGRLLAVAAETLRHGTPWQLLVFEEFLGDPAVDASWHETFAADVRDLVAEGREAADAWRVSAARVLELMATHQECWNLELTDWELEALRAGYSLSVGGDTVLHADGSYVTEQLGDAV